MKSEELNKEQRWKIADGMAKDRLPSINEELEDVVPSDNFYIRYGKRIIDIQIATTMLIITLPINMVIGIVTLFDVGRPILFKQSRVGKDGNPFTIIKFRNMKEIYDMGGNLLPAKDRVTRFGKFVRKTSLDELLNFWSVLKGDMSVIGPRPLVPEYTHRYNKRHKARLKVKPGLECPPRMKLTHAWSWQEQFDNDVWYVENVSFKTDLIMCLNLVRYAFDKKSSSIRSSATRGVFMGYSNEGRAISFEDLTPAEIGKYLYEE